MTRARIRTGECSVAFYGYMVETDAGVPLIWIFRLSDQDSNTFRQYYNELDQEMDRRQVLSTEPERQQRKTDMQHTILRFFSDASIQSTAMPTYLEQQKWCPFQNPADLRQKFDELLPDGETGMVFVSFMHDKQGLLYENGQLERGLVKDFIDISAEDSSNSDSRSPRFRLYDQDIISGMRMAYLPPFLCELEPPLIDPAFWHGWKEFEIFVKDDRGREASVPLYPESSPRKLSDVHSFTFNGREIAR